MFGGSKTVLRGRVSHIRRPSDVAGIYGAGGAGAALGAGVRAIVLTNEKGAVLTLSGRQVGLMANADLSGLGDFVEVGAGSAARRRQTTTTSGNKKTGRKPGFFAPAAGTGARR